MVLKTAALSLLNHKAKSIVLFVVLMLGSFLTLSGLSFMHTFTENLRTGLTEAITGDIVVHSEYAKQNVDIFMPIQQIPPIEDYKDAMDVLVNHPQINSAKVAPIAKDFALVSNPKTDEIDAAITVIGTDINNYINIFPKTRLEVYLENENEISITNKYIKSIPEDQTVMFFYMLPLDEKEKMIETLSVEDKETYLNLTPDEKKDEFPVLFSKDQREDFIKDLTEDEKYNIVLNFYNDIFRKVNVVDTINVDDSKLIPEGEHGILISKKWLDAVFRRNLASTYLSRIQLGKEFKMQSFSKKGFSILSVKIFGIIDNPGSDFSVMNNVLDMKTFQKLVGFDAESKMKTREQLIAEKKNEDVFLEDDEDALFDMEFSIGDGEEDQVEEDIEIDEELLEKPTGLGSTHYMIASLKNPNNIDYVVNDLNRIFKENDLEFTAVSYIKGSGTLGGFIIVLSYAVIGMIVIIQIISIFIITNSVLMGILERVNEIGTMRAIGAQRRYIFGLFYSESLILSVVASIVGILLSLLFLWIFGLIGIEAGNNFFASVFFGGEKLIPRTNLFYIVISFVIIVLTTFVATFYPVRVATKVSPLEAINKV